jgi:hypothetical protein
MTNVELHERRRSLEAAIITARESAGAAVLAGKRPDFDKIDRLQHELLGVLEAETLQVKQRHQEIDAERQAELDTLRKQLAALQQSRLADVKEAEAHTRGLAAALSRAFGAHTSMLGVMKSMGAPVPPVMMPTDFVSRMAGRLSAVMTTVEGHRHRLGSLSWPHSRYAATDSWGDGESKLTDKHLKLSGANGQS